MASLLYQFLFTDIQSLLQYAIGCLEFKNYLECIEVCDVIMKTKQDESTSYVIAQAKVTKGKERFYSYKRKLQQFFENSNVKRRTSQSEGKFDGMKETIALLARGLWLGFQHFG